jgi:hypothetical protein
VYWDQGNSATTTFIASTPFTVTTNTYTKNTQIQAGVYYRFKVAAVNFIGESLMSEPTISIIASEVPSAPLLLSQIEATETSIEFSWNPPLYDNGSPVEYYHVYIDDFRTSPDEGIAALSTVQTDRIITGFQHEFKVSAVNGRGEGVQSEPILIYAATISTKPANVRRKEAGSDFVTVQWDAPLSDGGTPILDYEVWWDLGAQNGVFELLTSSTYNTREFRQGEFVVSGNYYHFKVKAINVIGKSEFSEEALVIAANLAEAPGPLTEYTASIN